MLVYLHRQFWNWERASSKKMCTYNVHEHREDFFSSRCFHFFSRISLPSLCVSLLLSVHMCLSFSLYTLASITLWWMVLVKSSHQLNENWRFLAPRLHVLNITKKNKLPSIALAFVLLSHESVCWNWQHQNCVDKIAKAPYNWNMHATRGTIEYGWNDRFCWCYRQHKYPPWKKDWNVNITYQCFHCCSMSFSSTLYAFDLNRCDVLIFSWHFIKSKTDFRDPKTPVQRNPTNKRNEINRIWGAWKTTLCNFTTGCVCSPCRS